ncbi:MAG: ATP-binding domain-containing protein [Prevotellaceae bacterium]|jgi:superfamily I DNA/RNA helicase|nr:ATP-binding domain-containing protein [Prevotellaceae bacterium]
MRLENWFITNPDASQQEVLKVPISQNLVVKGVAGSGKTNMAIHRANQAGDDTFVIVVYTVALKKMVRYGLGELGLDKDRVVHEWSWIHRGIDISGDLFCFGKKKYPFPEECKLQKCYSKECETEECALKKECCCQHCHIRYSCVDKNILILKEDEGKVRFFVYMQKEGEDKIIQADTYRGYQVKEIDNPLEVSVDFDDWVHNRFYYNFYRRRHWFKEVEFTNFKLDPDADDIVFIPGGFLFKDKGIVNYLIIDEGQDFSLSNYRETFIPAAQKSVSIFGDTNQRIYKDRFCNLEEVAAFFQYPLLNLQYNYRIPKTIAKVAQKIIQPNIDLLSNNRKNNGNSDYPFFPKPVIKKCNSEEEELEYILNRIRNESMDDVAILLPNEDSVKKVHSFFSKNNVNTQVRIMQDIGVTPWGNRKFHRLDTLDFTNNDLPCILTYHSAKGTEFDNVFIPFAEASNGLERNPFYVALTRSSICVFITYSRILTSLLKDIDKNDVNFQ